MDPEVVARTLQGIIVAGVVVLGSLWIVLRARWLGRKAERYPGYNSDWQVFVATISWFILVIAVVGVAMLAASNCTYQSIRQLIF